MTKTLLTLFFALSAFSFVEAQTIYPLSDLTLTYYSGTSFTPVDSSHFGYTTPRTSKVMLGIFDYDSAITYNYNPGYAKYSKNTQVFGPINAILLSNWKIRDASGKKWIDSFQTNFSLNPANLDSTELTQYYDTSSGKWINLNRYIYTHDGSNNLTMILIQLYDTSAKTFINQGMYNYGYDASNRLDSFIYKTFSPSTGITNNSRGYYQYDTANLLTNYTHQGWDNVRLVWVQDSVNFYSYDALKNRIKTIYVTNATGPLLPAAMDTDTYDGSNNLLTITDKLYASGVYTNNRQYSWTYNTNNDPTIYETSTWSSDFATWIEVTNNDSETRYYYNKPDTTSDTTSAVKNVNNVAGNLRLFPTPAQGILNISLVWDNAQRFSVSIYNMNGQLVRQWSEPATKTYNKSIPVADLATGTYVINIRGENGRLSRQAMIIH